MNTGLGARGATKWRFRVPRCYVWEAVEEKRERKNERDRKDLTERGEDWTKEREKC